MGVQDPCDPFLTFGLRLAVEKKLRRRKFSSTCKIAKLRLLKCSAAYANAHAFQKQQEQQFIDLHSHIPRW